jgi:hypothetical protein
MQNWAKIRNYKCFGEEPQGFDDLKRFNIIIGRNNSGKSSLLDLVAFLTKPYVLPALRNGAPPEVLRMGLVDNTDYERSFPSDRSRTDIGSYDRYGMKYLNKVMTWRINANGHNELISIADAPPIEGIFKSVIVSEKRHPLLGKQFKRLSAERDIRPEESESALQLLATGFGATNLIQRYINDTARPSDLIETELLAALNVIFEPDAIFTRILVQRLAKNNSDNWEVFLDEHDKGRIALSDSGSGLKTVLLVLLLLLVVPHLEGKPLSSYVFAFEELENNTHPALQRRLLLFLHRLAVASDLTFFLTTHSTVAIDFFSRNADSQILYVTHDRRESKVQNVQAYEQNRKILDDLDLRASDMLQSNGVVWVEGPSDRLYFRRWVDLWSEGKLIEGVHYQCLFYGGKLLKHISCEEPNCDTGRVQILTVNRNAMVLMDSDIRIDGKLLTETKRRVIEELARIDGLAWVTAAKEVENYIPESVLSCVLGVKIESVKLTDTVWDAANAVEDGLGDKRKRDKVGLAEEVVPLLDRTDLESQFDWSEMMPRVCAEIARWNGVSFDGASVKTKTVRVSDESPNALWVTQD